MTDIITLKENFNSQIKITNEQIIEFEEKLEKTKEYKLKLLGGLETLALLDDDGKQEPPAPEAE